ncbi:MAG: site-specific integrase, partial [Mesorhizobium sp.]
RLVQGGIDIRRVQMWLGHQTLSMTMRYAHLATNDLDGCVTVLETPRCSGADSGGASALSSPPPARREPKSEPAASKAPKPAKRSAKS